MKILLITEKCSSYGLELDGGARLVNTLGNAFGDSLSIMQFGSEPDSVAAWHFKYPFHSQNRFEKRLANGKFIAEKVKCEANRFTHVFFIHISMQFGMIDSPLDNVQIWTFPMFLTPSYVASGEKVPQNYFEMEKKTLAKAQHILTPSHWEKRQLIEFYSVPKERIHVIPRGIDMRTVSPKQRSYHKNPQFCSVGSIKPQKNTMGLIEFFAKILATYPEASLKIIGPVQNAGYHEDVCSKIKLLKLKDRIEMVGHVPSQKLAMALKDAHLHLSTSTCETFGRAIFETLAAGLPNIARSTGNAAAEYLANLPYACFTDDTVQALHAVDGMLDNLPKLSKMALEVGQLYDDQILSSLLIAKICRKEIIAISDFDGTLFHKDDHHKTVQCIEAFQSYPFKILCSARPIHDLLEKLKQYKLSVDWIIGLSGSVVTNGLGRKLWHVPLDLEKVSQFEEIIPQTERIEMEGEVLQLAFSAETLPDIFSEFRLEVYQGMAFISHWEASKFRAVHRLLKHIHWSGRVVAFGDGPYDVELLNYFDGIFIKKDTFVENQEVFNITPSKGDSHG